MILLFKFACITDLGPKLAKRAKYASVVFSFRKINENYARNDEPCQKLC